MDKNTIIGFGLLMTLLIGMMYYNQTTEEKMAQQQLKDSVALATQKPIDSLIHHATNDTSINSIADSNIVLQSAPEQMNIIENDFIILSFTNKGAFPVKAELKKFKTYDGNPLLLFDGNKNLMNYEFKSAQGNLIQTKSITFSPNPTEDKKLITYSSPQAEITYKLDDNSYLLHVSVKPVNSDKSQQYTLQWKSESMLTERDLESQKLYSQVCYDLEKEGYDFFTIKEKASHDLKENVKWLTFKQHYFNTTIITNEPLISQAKINVMPLATTDTNSKVLNDFDANLTLQPKDHIQFDMFLGPNDYQLLKSYGKNLEEMIPLSYGIFGFVKYINKWIVMPIFDGLAKFVSSFGLVIVLLTIIIRLLMSPFTYKSYVSSAKMKALKPDMDALREKLGDDKQAFGVEQMKLYRQAGVNPLGGCLPALLQLPVFFALLSFFPHAIQLRQEKFLWAKDLSTYDSILNLPFSIPFYGNHVSLFTILFVITSILMALYSMNMTVDQGNPMMKYIPFVMPIMFLGIFNKLPASLTLYYFISNLITLILQFVIQNYIIDSNKIHAEIEAKKKEQPKESKFMQRMAELQKQQQERVNQQQKKK